MTEDERERLRETLRAVERCEQWRADDALIARFLLDLDARLSSFEAWILEEAARSEV